ncbi:MAG: response regulator transcription factor [Collinsella intestinalis]
MPDAVLLDIMLPDTDGLEIMRRLRADQATATVPIMMLTAKDSELDKVVALDGGADDYLAKPFSLMELTSRCRALLRRGGMMSRPAPEMLSVGGIELSPSHREVRVDGHELKLTLREFDLLEYLMRKPGVVFTRESLLQSVWGWDFDGGSRTVDVHVRPCARSSVRMPIASRRFAAWAIVWSIVPRPMRPLRIPPNEQPSVAVEARIRDHPGDVAHDHHRVRPRPYLDRAAAARPCDERRARR